MAGNSFGTIFKIMTWGESHGKAIGVVIDGCPAGLKIEESEIHEALASRAPGKNAFMTSRTEADRAEILSGVFQGKTTGAPISIIIPNQDADSSKYEDTKDLLKPGHANYTYLEKYGIFDYRGGGRASARETACRVVAGAIAKKVLMQTGMEIIAYVKQIGEVEAIFEGGFDFIELKNLVRKSPIFCPDSHHASLMMKAIEEAKINGDSLGGSVEFLVRGMPAGLGDPIYEKLEANLAHAMLTLPATKAFEIGSGFKSVMMSGSLHNDSFICHEGQVKTHTNHAGGTLGGISTGMPLIGKVAFKPPSSIMKPQSTVDRQGNSAVFQLSQGSRHDPCVAIRAVPVVEAMVALVLVDAWLLNRCARL